MRRGNVDKNHPEIVRKLRMIGASVQSTASVGGGFPDIVVGWRGLNYLFEIKDGKNKTQANQDEFHAAWRGSIHVVYSFDEILKILNINQKPK